MISSARLLLLRQLCAVALLVPLIAAAAPRDPAPISDQVIQKLVTDSLPAAAFSCAKSMVCPSAAPRKVTMVTHSCVFLGRNRRKRGIFLE